MYKPFFSVNTSILNSGCACYLACIPRTPPPPLPLSLSLSRILFERKGRLYKGYILSRLHSSLDICSITLALISEYLPYHAFTNLLISILISDCLPHYGFTHLLISPTLRLHSVARVEVDEGFNAVVDAVELTSQ